MTSTALARYGADVMAGVETTTSPERVRTAQEYIGLVVSCPEFRGHLPTVSWLSQAHRLLTESTSRDDTAASIEHAQLAHMHLRLVLREPNFRGHLASLIWLAQAEELLNRSTDLASVPVPPTPDALW